jgi:D-3-phosphoglycerate dehydrogenase / 2-oxoglutarate reductase
VIVVPDDFPSVFDGSEGHQRAKRLDEVRVFTERGADQEDELIRRIGDATAALNIRAHARFSVGVFAACPKLKIVSVWGTGTDNIDLNAAGMRGITVCNTPGINAFAVAEHALTLMLTTARKVITLDAEMRKGKWPREMLTQCLGKTLGVFGMGAIGARLASIAKGIGMNVLGWSALGDDARIRKTGATPASKEEILARADVISLHVRLSGETRNFLGRKELAMMKPTAILVNTGRGALVDRDALLAALREHRIMGAGLDVFHQEPLAHDDPILSLPNVVVSPHNAGQTPEVIRDGLIAAVANVEHFLQGKPSNLVVSPGR